jgi:hypothetical protein
MKQTQAPIVMAQMGAAMDQGDEPETIGVSITIVDGADQYRMNLSLT